MKFTSIICIFLSVVFLSACASKKKGFNRGDLKHQIGVVSPEVKDGAIQEALERKANLPKPFKLAVYFKTPIQNRASISSWRWDDEDKNAIYELAKKLEKEKIISKVFPIIGSLVQDEDLKSIRLVAAKHGADALLIVSGISDIDRYINNWGWSYILLAPALFVPGSEVDGLFLASASMWDVRNEFLYITAESEAETHDTYIAAFGQKDKFIISKAKKDAMEKLKIQIVAMIMGSQE